MIGSPLREKGWKAAPGRLGRLSTVQAVSLAVLGAVAIVITFALTQQVSSAQTARQDAESVRSQLITLRDELRKEHVEYWKRRSSEETGVPPSVVAKLAVAAAQVDDLAAQSRAAGSPAAIAAANETERLLAEVRRGVERIQNAPNPAVEEEASDRNERVISALATAASDWVAAETRRAGSAADRQEQLANRLSAAVTGVVAALIVAALAAWLVLERARRQVVADLKGAAEHLEDLSVTDALTGLANRRGFDQALAVEMARARRTGRPLSVAMFDIDHFKEVNDLLGHAGGDAVLREVARRLDGVARSHELVARIGGEEFAWLLPEADGEVALHVAERARAAVSETFIEGLLITVSAGVSDFASAGDDLVARADSALYLAKGAGRNRSVRASGGE